MHPPVGWRILPNRITALAFSANFARLSYGIKEREQGCLRSLLFPIQVVAFVVLALAAVSQPC